MKIIKYNHTARRIDNAHSWYVGERENLMRLKEKPVMSALDQVRFDNLHQMLHRRNAENLTMQARRMQEAFDRQKDEIEPQYHDEIRQQIQDMHLKALNESAFGCEEPHA